MVFVSSSFTVIFCITNSNEVDRYVHNNFLPFLDETKSFRIKIYGLLVRYLHMEGISKLTGLFLSSRKDKEKNHVAHKRETKQNRNGMTAIEILVVAALRVLGSFVSLVVLLT